MAARLVALRRLGRTMEAEELEQKATQQHGRDAIATATAACERDAANNAAIFRAKHPEWDEQNLRRYFAHNLDVYYTPYLRDDFAWRIRQVHVARFVWPLPPALVGTSLMCCSARLSPLLFGLGCEGLPRCWSASFPCECLRAFSWLRAFSHNAASFRTAQWRSTSCVYRTVACRLNVWFAQFE
jgi:hypothetical protein